MILKTNGYTQRPIRKDTKHVQIVGQYVFKAQANDAYSACLIALSLIDFLGKGPLSSPILFASS